MNLKKILVSLITIMIFGVFTLAQGVSYAQQVSAGQEHYMGVIQFMTHDEPNMGYAIRKPGTNNSAYIWNIVEYESASSSTYKANKDIYCVRAGVGFTETDPKGELQRRPYNVFYDMKTERETIKQNEKIKGGLVNGKYNQILAVLDMLYLPEKSTQEEKLELVQKSIQKAIKDGNAENYMTLLTDEEELKDNLLKDDDMKAVQQAVLWYFTNSDESEKYNLIQNNESWLNYIIKDNGQEYDSLSNYNPTSVNTEHDLSEGQWRSYQANFLYRYMINQAEQNASNYENINSNSGAPAQLKTQTLDGTESNGKYIIGPIKIEQLNSTPYTIDFTVKNNGTDVEYQLLNESQEVAKNQQVKDLVGKDFYLSIDKNSVESITLNVKIKYNNTTMTLWTSSKQEEQPLVEVDKTPEEEEEQLTYTPPKQFDLALRKYITQVNGTAVQQGPRNPEITNAETALAKGNTNSTSHTATYSHRKDPVKVKQNDEVTYTIEVFNEGNVAGRATEITDQLPEGVKYIQGSVSGDYTYKSYDETSNTLVLQKANTDNLVAYPGSGAPKSNKVTIKCKVTAEPGEKEKIYTNLAWISGDAFAETGTDLDSHPTTPTTRPSANELVSENKNDYKGNTENPDVSSEKNYWKGQEDDDDFEKLVIEQKPKEEPKQFDLALRKYIIQVNGTAVQQGPRNPEITNAETALAKDNTDAKNHTATYSHRKDPVKVKENDEVTYTIEVFNEGNVAGRATEITDQLPEGVKYIQGSVSGDYTYKSYNESTNTLVLQKGNENNIEAYSGSGAPKSNKVTIKCKVTAKPGEEEKVYTNLAWISGDAFAETGTDLDSHPTTPTTHPSANELVSEDKNNYKGNTENPDVSSEKNYWKGQEDDDDFEKLIIEPELKEEPKQFDLALRKYITQVNGTDVQQGPRNPEITNAETALAKDNTDPKNHTATYSHRKDPVRVKENDEVTYTIEVFNEGNVAGRATEITDQLPEGVKYIQGSVSGDYAYKSYNESTNTLVLQKENENNIEAYPGSGAPKSNKVTIKCKVTAKPEEKEKVYTNLAWISGDAFAETGTDLDSHPTTPTTHPSAKELVSENENNYKGNTENPNVSSEKNYWKGQEDDDDFEKLVIEPEQKEEFDLKLIKRIVEVNGQKVPERIENIDVSKLNTSDADAKTTADYTLNKEPVGVAKGDIVTYTFRIYNEGMIDGYAQEITEDVPEGLQFLWSEKEGEELKTDKTLTDEEKEAIEFNQTYLWGKFVYDDTKKNIIQISSDYLSKEEETTEGENLIKAFGHNDGTKTREDLDKCYKEISVKFKVISENVAGTIIRNEAAITEDCDKDRNPVDDRDSDTEKWVKYEDDEDYDNVILQSFDLALRKFIIAVSADTKIDNNEYLKNQDGSYTRAPIVDTSKLNTTDENGKLITTATYNHTKEPIIVKPNDIVIYMLRVYNEGDVDGYASEIKDHLPPYLEYVDSEYNQQYGWEVSENGRTVTTKYLADSLLKKAEVINSKAGASTDSDFAKSQRYELYYKEVPIMCKVSEKAKTSENITNIADITEYLDKNKKPIADRDSQEDNVKLPEDENLPKYKENEKGSYVPGQQDDDDFEKVNIKIFDLALRKWVTQAIVIENGKQTVTQTGHDAWDDPEAVVKVELHRKKLNQVAVKFRYSIRVYNQGEIEGYAKEVTDYIPEGLKFEAVDNPGWKDEGNNVISTRLLENTLLQPGEYADVEVLLTWINNENNMGVMNNTAEISEDYNEYDVPDIDSTPDNKKSGEDDIDDAPVMLSISTGQMRIYFTLGFIVLITSASGVILIKKFVL